MKSLRSVVSSRSTDSLDVSSSSPYAEPRMEAVLERVDLMEEKIFGVLEKLTGEVKELREQQAELLARETGHPAGQTGAGSIALPRQGREHYRIYKAVLDNPNSNRTSKQSSFFSVGTALYNGIEEYNTVAVANGTGQIPQMTMTPRTFTRDAMRTVGMLLGGSKVFRSHIGVKTYQEIKAIYANTPHTFQIESSEVSKKLLKEYPILEIAKGFWAAHELIKGKLINLKEERKKKESMWDTDVEDFHPDFLSESESSSYSSDSETEEERRASAKVEISVLKDVARRQAKKKAQNAKRTRG